jgi:hypothetical protein
VGEFSADITRSATSRHTSSTAAAATAAAAHSSPTDPRRMRVITTPAATAAATNVDIPAYITRCVIVTFAKPTGDTVNSDNKPW